MDQPPQSDVCAGGARPKAARGPSRAIFIAMFFVYLLSGSRERPWGDALVMHQVAQAMLSRAEFSVPRAQPPLARKGADGKIYSQYGLVASLVGIPGAIIREGVRYAHPELDPLVWPLTSHLASSACGALICVIFFGLCRRLGAGAGLASWLTIGLGLSTAVWVYSRYAYSDIVQAALVLALFRQLLRVADDPCRADALLLGLWGGLLVNAKAIYAVSLAGAALFLLWAYRQRLRQLVVIAGWGLLAFLPLLAALLWYNYARWGDPLLTGYEGQLSRFSHESPWVALLGLFTSPGKSLFLFNPVLVLSLVGLPAFVRRYPAMALAAALVLLPPIAVYSKLLNWTGGYCWGPRYLTYCIPLLLLPVVSLLARSTGRWSRRVVVGALLALLAWGAVVQVLGNALYWDHFIRISKQARSAWLSDPNRKGAFIEEKRRGHCDECFEDMYPHVWLPAFQPIEGHAWLLGHVLAEDDDKTAELDAPWHRYTSLRLDIRSSYRRARIDWWGLLWLEDHRRTEWLGALLLVFFAAAATGGAWDWITALRRRGGDAGGG